NRVFSRLFINVRVLPQPEAGFRPIKSGEDVAEGFEDCGYIKYFGKIKPMSTRMLEACDATFPFANVRGGLRCFVSHTTSVPDGLRVAPQLTKYGAARPCRVDILLRHGTFVRNRSCRKPAGRTSVSCVQLGPRSNMRI